MTSHDVGLEVNLGVLADTGLETSTPAPWSQRDDESSEQYEAFFFYRSLPPHQRKLNLAYRQMLSVRHPQRLADYREPRNVVAPTRWQEWVTKFEWDQRANAWDDEVRRALMGQEVEGVKDMLSRHKSALLKLQEKGMEFLEDEGFDSSAAALRAVHHSQTMEREMAGLPNVAHIMVMDGDDLIARYQKLIEQLSGEDGGDDEE